MATDPVSFSIEEMEQRRRRTSSARKASMVRPPTPPKFESEAMAAINEIFNPTFVKPVSKGPYRAPDELTAGDLDVMQDIDIRKLAELKEVFLLLDLDSDGLISKDDLRFTFTALGTDTADEQIEEMLKEAKDPLDYDSFIELMCHRTVELDPEDVLLEAWSKWDEFGIGKVEEKNCLDHIEIFPFLREPVIEDSSNPDYVICNHTALTLTNVSAFASPTISAATSSPTTTKSTIKQQRQMIANANTTTTMASLAASNKKAKQTTINSVANNDANNSFASDVRDLRANEFIYSSGKIFGIRVRFKKIQQRQGENALQTVGDDALENWQLNITGEYRFLKKEYFKNDGRLIPGTYCDYYFFADANAKPESFEIWKYFHSPQFPAKYPAHIKCAYKFIGRPETRVEIVFEELQLPKTGKRCSIDKLTIFDSESANMNAVIDVICDATPTRRIISSGPDLLIEFNASSNITAKGFRGKFKFTHNEVEDEFVPAVNIEATTEKIIALERIGLRQVPQHPVVSVDEWDNFFKNNVYEVYTVYELYEAYKTLNEYHDCVSVSDTIK